MEEGVRVEIMCQAKGRPQPEVTLMVMTMLVILVPLVPIAKVTYRISIEEAPKYFLGDYNWDKRQPSWPEHYYKVRSIAATKFCHGKSKLCFRK